MKTLLALITLLSLGSFAHAAPLDGKFVNRSSQPMTNIQGRVQCRAAGGQGGGDNDICMIPSQDSVVVKKMGSVFIVKVDTFGPDLDSCGFKGRGVKHGENEILATQSTEMRKGGAAEDFMPIQGRGLCKVRLTYKGNQVSVSSSRDCEFLCGQQAQLSTVVKRK